MSTLKTTNLQHASSASANIVLDSAGRALVGLSSANANGGILQLSSGITFPATQVLSTDPNTLDDYEEGTWTPIVRGDATAGTATYSAQQGAYVKIGKVVYISGYLGWSSGTGTGSLQIGGLPFTVSSTDPSFEALTVGFLDGLTLPANSVLTLAATKNTTLIGCNAYPLGGGNYGTIAYDANVTHFRFCGFYFT